MNKKYYLSEKLQLIAGVDESGCGSLVGPVIAAAVIFYPTQLILRARDSKKLSKKQRCNIYQNIIQYALAWSIGISDVEEIDRINIFHARLLAMRRAVLNLTIKPDLILVDGKHAPLFHDINYQCFIKGDSRISIISAASIIAKIVRDQSMLALNIRYPKYGFSQNNGYPTIFHLKQLALHGPTLFHRKSFSPIKYMIMYIIIILNNIIFHKFF